jgi:predicted RNase H-like HicB family nuclease
MRIKKMPDRDADDEMRAEYDFSGGVRGKYAERHARGTQLTTVIQRGVDGFVSLCPELDVGSQGDTVEEARTNLMGAVELFFEAADESEVPRRCQS